MLSTDDIVAITLVLNRVHHIIDEAFSPHSVSPNRGHYELLREVFTEDVIQTWIDHKRQKIKPPRRLG